MIRVGNDKLLIDDKELKRLVKEGYDRGVIFGCIVNATKVVQTLKTMTPDNFEIVRNQAIGFCQQTIDIADQNKKKGN